MRRKKLKNKYNFMIKLNTKENINDINVMKFERSA